MTIRRLAAILAADVVSYSTMMGKDEEGTLEKIKALRREMIEPKVTEHHGRVVKTTGDGFLVEFASPVEAVRCAIGIQDAAGAGPLQLRIGINLGDIIIEPDGDVYGDGVNIAARLEGIADPSGIALSGSVYDQVRKVLPHPYEDLGWIGLKNIDEPVRVYAVRGVGAAPPSTGSTPRFLPLPDKPSIAVLPFTNMSGDPEQEYFADGIVEDIITALSRVRWFFVIARNSLFTYKGRAVDIRQVGRELGVRYVLEGAIRKAGGRIRITGQLIETTSGRHVWADRFDGNFSDVFKLQDQITESVVGAIEPNIQQAEIERAKHKSTRNPDAYDELLCALPLLATGSKESIEQAHHLLTRAIEADPNYAYAMALLSTCHHYRVLQAWGTDDDTQEGLRLANKAIAIGHNDPVVLAVAAMSLAYFSRDHGKAAHLIERSLALHPASASTHSRAGWLRNYMGQPERAITHFETAMRLSPVDLEMSQFLTGLSIAQLQMEQWSEACGTAQRAIDLQANWSGSHRARVVGFVHLGMMNEAEVAARKLLEAMPRFSLSEYSRTSPFKTNAFWWRWVDALRKAGLPE